MSHAQQGPLAPDHYRCAECGVIYGHGWTEEEAVAEALSNGVDLFDAEIVCDDCYRRSPLGLPS